MRGRKPGGKNTDGTTRSMILLRIADRPVISTEDLWAYLHARNDKRCRMDTKNQLYIHLRWLNRNGFIDSTRHTRSEYRKHTIRGGFEYFIALYNFLKGHDFKRELMTCSQYHDYTELGAFMERYAVYQFKNAMLKIYSHAHYRGATDQERLFDVFRVKGEDQARFINEYESLIVKLREHDIDELIPVIKQAIQDHRGQTIIGPDYLSAQALHYINKVEDASLQKMLREQPSVVDFLINTHHYDPTFIHNLVIWLLPTQGIDEPALKNIMMQEEDGKSGYLNITELIEQFRDPYEKNESPLYQIIRSLALTDRIKNEVQRLETTRPIQKQIGDI